MPSPWPPLLKCHALRQLHAGRRQDLYASQPPAYRCRASGFAVQVTPPYASSRPRRSHGRRCQPVIATQPTRQISCFRCSRQPARPPPCASLATARQRRKHFRRFRVFDVAATAISITNSQRLRGFRIFCAITLDRHVAGCTGRTGRSQAGSAADGAGRLRRRCLLLLSMHSWPPQPRLPVSPPRRRLRIRLFSFSCRFAFAIRFERLFRYCRCNIFADLRQVSLAEP